MATAHAHATCMSPKEQLTATRVLNAVSVLKNNGNRNIDITTNFGDCVLWFSMAVGRDQSLLA